MAVKINLKLLFTILVAALIVAGCSAKPKEPIEVKIDANEFSFKSALTEFRTGETYRFVVTNTGSVAHEFMIAPLSEPGMADMEQIDKMALVMIPQEDLPAGAMKSVEFTFNELAATRQLEFACHVPGHYEAGMKLPIVVK